MSKGAKEMVAACMFPEKEKGGRGKKVCSTRTFPGVDPARLSNARAVRELAPDLVPEVKTSETSLADAYAKAMALPARGLTQRQIAEKLGVTHPIVAKWLVNFGTLPELTNEPTLPDAATLDRIAQAIKNDAKGEVRLEVEALVRDEIAELRRRALGVGWRDTAGKSTRNFGANAPK